MDRKAKQRKLDDFRRALPHCSASALSAICKAIKASGMPDGSTGRKELRAARDLICSTATPVGPIIQRVTLIGKVAGEPVKLFTVAHPLASLWQACNECVPFARFMSECLRRHPCSIDNPWSIVLYSDEVTPGNVVAVINNRKFHAIYWSFLDFGHNALSYEETWFCVATELSNDMNTYSAGLSQAFAAIILLFFDPDGIDLSTAGFLLPINGGTRLWAKVGGVLQDGGAHKSVWHHRGDGAHKFCLICQNLVAYDSKLCDEDGSNLLTCRSTKHTQLIS